MMDLVRRFCSENNIDISEAQISHMEDFCSFLVEKNKVMNLTAITEQGEMEIKHLVDSLEGLPVIRELADEMGKAVDELKLIDIGCGAGFPGIPLKIMLPEAEFVLLDSLHKRISFVNEAAGKLGLENIEAVAARAEEYADELHRESFDICVSRAVAESNVLLEYCLPFVKVGGFCILYKSDNCQEELLKAQNAIDILGGSVCKNLRLELPDGSGRNLVIIKKVSPTPAKYPRRPGKPSKKPL